MAETMQVSAQRAWTHLKKYQPLIHELVSRDLKVKYRRSFLGYIWSILNPLLMMLLQSIIFSYMFRNDIPNFPLYLICGNTLFTFFNETTSMGLTSVIQNAPLIKKVYIPKFIFPISQAVSRFVTMLFSFGAVLLVMNFYPCHLLLDHLFELAAAGAALLFQLRAGAAAFRAGGVFP